MSVCRSLPSGIPTDSGFKWKMLGLDLFLHFFSCFVLLPFIVFFFFFLLGHWAFTYSVWIGAFLIFLTSPLLLFFHVSYRPHVNVLALTFPENFALSPLKLTWTPMLSSVAVHSPASLVMSLVSWLMWVSMFIGFSFHSQPISIFKFCPPPLPF